MEKLLMMSLTTGTTNEIITAISTVGFPIVACAAMFWQMRESNKQHKEESEKWAEALNNNTIALTRLVDKLDEGEK